MTSIPPSVSINQQNWDRQWSPNVLEFYYDGDNPSCYSSYTGLTPLGKDWWGGLLGFTGAGFIQKTVP